MQSTIQNCRSLVLIFVLLAPFTVRAELLEAATAHWSPYAMQVEQRQLQGISVEILQEIIKRSNNEVMMQLHPTERLNQLFDDKQIDINFADSPVWNQQSKDPQYVFSESYTTVFEYIYFLEENYKEVNAPDDLSEKFVGVTRGYYYEDYEDFFNTGKIKKHEAYSNSNLIALLDKNRVDAAFFDDVLFNYLLKTEHFAKCKFKRGKRLSTAPLGLKLIIEKQYLLQGINNAIAEMKADGTIKDIVDKYIN